MWNRNYWQGKILLSNRKYLEVESDVANWAQIFDKRDLKTQKYKQELTPYTEYQPCRMFVRKYLVQKKLKTAENHQKNF